MDRVGLVGYNKAELKQWFANSLHSSREFRRVAWSFFQVRTSI